MKTLHMPNATSLQDIFSQCRAGVFHKKCADGKNRSVKDNRAASEYFCSIQHVQGAAPIRGVGDTPHFLNVKPTQAFFDALGPLTYGGSFELIFWSDGQVLVLCNAMWDTRAGSSQYWLALLPAQPVRDFIASLEVGG